MRHHVLAVTVLLVACAHAGDAAWSVPAGSTVVINEPITIPAESASVIVQDGKTMSFSVTNMYAPHCILEVRNRRDIPQIVRPGRFTVTRNIQGESYVSFVPGVVAGVFVSGSDSPIAYTNELYITSPEQPDVFRLTCRQYSFPSLTPLDERYTTVAQMQAALGKLITLEPLRPASGVAR